MRALALLLAGLTLSACATPAPRIETAHMPLDIVRAEGQAPRLGQITLVAGDWRGSAPFWLGVHFATDGTRLSPPQTVIWSVNLGDYCRDRPSTVQSVLIGPQGQVWKAEQVSVPAGPDRPEISSLGSTAPRWPQESAAGLLDALAQGGRFTLALQDDEGRRWHEVVVDTLSPPEWQRLFDANLVTLRALDPAGVPVSDGRYRIRPEIPFVQPSPPRRCPAR